MNAIVKCPNCAYSLNEIDGVCPQCGKTYCPECGAFLADEANYCPVCGIEFASYCSSCDEEVPNDATVCPHCGAPLEEPQLVDDSEIDLKPINLILPAQYSGECPLCASPVFLEDGYCGQCGATFCSHCGTSIDEEDETCPNCQISLYFNCPLCGFELMAGTDQCPNCDALVPTFCAVCRTPLPRDAQQCPQCATPVRVISRKSARVIHTLNLGNKIVQVAACPECGGQLHLNKGLCTICGYRICPTCQIGLLPDENVCPRCGPENAQIVLASDQGRKCSNCGQSLQVGDDECPHCGQFFCPECFAPIGEEDPVCKKCGVEFEFECPHCGQLVGAIDEICVSCGAEI
jgi:predicted amidophosphoribosyltransferase